MQQDTVHLPTPQQVSGPQHPEGDSREDTVREGAPKDLYTDSSRKGDAEGDSQTSKERRERSNSYKNGTRESLREQRRGTELIRLREEDRYRNLERPRNGNREREHRGRLRISPSNETDERDEERDGCWESFWDCDKFTNWECSGGELEENYCRYSRRRREYTDSAWLQDAKRYEDCSDWATEGATSWKTIEQAERVEEDWGRQISEPLYKSSMEKSSVPNLTRGKKTQTGISRDEGDDEQLFIPLGVGIEGRSGEAHTGVGGEVVQPDIHGQKEERIVEKDTRLQSS
eukprot:MONOS_14372.1-p1 / transcript=MONOS_14372.1 / gene=MONOS_14372 / organism=Monocercomonoides_exilis_PA203 / gene_product=unspecified product / transcript_product=unspecified product / location=Mono_scaffold00990:19649-20742(-) / protein_length=288 / sequence_SO=supercontig / SO=protein_coding / is_pseudo=false